MRICGDGSRRLEKASKATTCEKKDVVDDDDDVE